MRICLLFVALFFAVIGLSAMMSHAWLFLYRPRKIPAVITLIPLSTANAEKEFLYYYEKYRWYGADFTDQLIFIGESDLLPPSCKRLIDEDERLLICQREQLSDIF